MAFLAEDDNGYIFYEVKFGKNPLSSERVDKEKSPRVFARARDE